MLELLRRLREGRLNEVGGADEELPFGAGGLEEACLCGIWIGCVGVHWSYVAHIHNRIHDGTHGVSA